MASTMLLSWYLSNNTYYFALISFFLIEAFFRSESCVYFLFCRQSLLENTDFNVVMVNF